MSEPLFDALFDQSAVGIAAFSIGGRFLRANPAFCRLLGYTEQELLQKTHLDVIHVEDLEAAAVSRAQVISGKMKPRLSERRYMHKDGSTVWVQMSGVVIRDEAGAPQSTVLVASDISPLKRAARKSKQRFRRMVEMSSDWYWVQDEQFRFVEVGGLEAQEQQDTDIVVGSTRWQLPGLAPLPEKAWEQHRAKLERHESFSDFVFLRYNKAGELRYLSVSGEPLFDEKGKFTGYHGVGKDITERARDQKAIEDSEKRYRTLFDVHPQPMWVVDANTLAFLAVNGAAMRLYGYSKEEFLAMSADQIRPEEDVDDLRRAFADWSNNYSQRIWRHKRKAGQVIPVKVTSFNLEFAGRRARLGVIEDLSERLMAEERAKQSEQRYRELLQQRGGGSE
ncbi:MAG TPA: PAS domain S-box protein [Burkholderiales bacterium]|nr:PAS domain S-box protein [Burkholderiales bacterium]HVJ24533.1 PAS domain S-box protein [Burkholderiales bacterium]